MGFFYNCCFLVLQFGHSSPFVLLLCVAVVTVFSQDCQRGKEFLDWFSTCFFVFVLQFFQGFKKLILQHLQWHTMVLSQTQQAVQLVQGFWSVEQEKEC